MSALAAMSRDDISREALAALPVPIYITDSDGTIIFYNDAATRFWGRAPELYKEKWCGSHRLYWPDGRLMAHNECPMAQTLKTGKAVTGVEAIVERPDGSRAAFIPHPMPLRDAKGRLTGAINMLVDVTERNDFERSSARLSAIVESSDDAILSKDLNGIIQSWNKGAERIFGYAAEEAIGQPVLMLIPEDRHDEEPAIIERIRLGERVDHYETLRRRKDGTLIDISLTISPVKDKRGIVIGASKIARDISDRKHAEREKQKQTRRLDILNQIAKMLSSDLDQERIVQAVIDIATELSSAQFGAFFYNVVNNSGEAYLLYALSGAPREAFERFGIPRNTAVFELTFRGAGPVRSDDIRVDPRYGKNAPHHGMPEGHLPVASYLAVPVISRSGETVGGLFFGHEQPGVFTQESEDLVMGIASHAAIAMDNARLHKAANAEVAQRKRAEEAKDLLLHEIKHRVKNTLGTVQAIASQTFRAAPREERDAFGARLRAMAEAHDLLTNQDWGDVAVKDLIDRAVAAFNPKRFSIQGDQAALPSAKALLLAMAVHELGTNAVKYGALSNTTGRVDIAWQSQDHVLVLQWRESGGPIVATPAHKGFGTNLIQRALAGEQGRAQLDYAPDGLKGTLEIRY
ncbi:MAG TPA: PAS domain S-box protein [Rhizomicrobium sp.]|jgi:PAS domain S-box-containing protein